MPSPKAEKEWLEGPSRRVIVHARRIRNERKRLLALCGFFNLYRSLFSRPNIPIAMDIIEKYAEGKVDRSHLNRAIGMITAFNWEQEKLISDPPLLDLIKTARAVIVEDIEVMQSGHTRSTGTRDVEAILPMFDLVDVQAGMLRDVFGNPFRSVAIEPRWLSSTVVSLASGIYEERAIERMPILADALQDADCDNDDILNHCRSEGPHVRGCWVVDLLLQRSQ